MIQIKNAAELEKMRKAAAISAAALKAGGEAIEPGITTAEIDQNYLRLYRAPWCKTELPSSVRFSRHGMYQRE